MHTHTGWCIEIKQVLKSQYHGWRLVWCSELTAPHRAICVVHCTTWEKFKKIEKLYFIPLKQKQNKNFGLFFLLNTIKPCYDALQGTESGER